MKVISNICNIIIYSDISFYKLDETHFKKRQLPIIIEEKILNKFQIKGIF